MEQLVAWLIFTNILTIKLILKLKKENDVLHNNNIGLGQALVMCGGMTQEQYEKSINK